MRFDIAAQPGRLPGATLGEGHITLRPGHLGEPREHFIKEKTQPDAFPFALGAHQVHAVIPVAGAHERQAVFTKAEGPQDGSHTVVIQTGRF